MCVLERLEEWLVNFRLREFRFRKKCRDVGMEVNEVLTAAFRRRSLRSSTIRRNDDAAGHDHRHSPSQLVVGQECTNIIVRSSRGETNRFLNGTHGIVA